MIIIPQVSISMALQHVISIKVKMSCLLKLFVFNFLKKGVFFRDISDLAWRLSTRLCLYFHYFVELNIQQTTGGGIRQT